MTIRLQLFSDLHADFDAQRPIEVDSSVDIVVVPGDVCESAARSFTVLRSFVPMKVPIVFVMGNHEYYRKFFDEELEEARRVAPNFNVTLLERDVAVVANTVRFIGATCWTDYRLFGDHLAPAAMAAARDKMTDHKRIGWRKQPWSRFRPQEAALLHAQARQFIRDAIKVPFADGPTIVATHHAVSVRSIPDAWKDDVLTAAYSSTILDDLLSDPSMPRVDYWFHGHIHASADYRIGSTTRVVCNPHGYPDEVTGFNPDLIFDIES